MYVREDASFSPLVEAVGERHLFCTEKRKFRGEKKAEEGSGGFRNKKLKEM